MSDALQRLHAWFATACNRNERGASLVEYALLVALIALVCFVAVGLVGRTTSSSYRGVGNSLAAN